MFRPTTLIWLLITAALGFGLYQIKYEVQSQEERLVRINRQILDNEEAIQVLNAEWSYLNRPDRLAEMARRYLEMSPVTPAQFTKLASLPDRSPVMEAAAVSIPPAAKAVTVKASPAPQATTPQASIAVAKPAPHPPASAAAAPSAAPKPVASPEPQKPAAKPGMQTIAYSLPPAPGPQREKNAPLSHPSVLVAGLLQALADAPASAPAPARPEGPAGAR